MNPKCPECGSTELHVACHTMYKMIDGEFGEIVTDGPQENLMSDTYVACAKCDMEGEFRLFDPDQPIALVPITPEASKPEILGVVGGCRMPMCPHCSVALVRDGNDAPGFHHCPQCSSSFMSVRVRCDDCGWKGIECELSERLESMSDLAARLDVGGEVPAGVCPECGALAYLERTNNKMWAHMDHIARLEVAWYGKSNLDGRGPGVDSVTVECTQCGEVVHELFNAEFER